MQILTSIIVAALCSLNILQAQISVPGRYRSLIHDSFKKSGKDNLKEYRLPEQDNAQLVAQAEADESVINPKNVRKQMTSGGIEAVLYSGKLPKTAPYKFGKIVNLNIEMGKDDQDKWTVNEEAGTRIWRFKVYSRDAHTVSIHFSDFHLAPSTELYIIGEEETLGAFTSLNNKEDKAFGISPVSGDFLILEYIEPIKNVQKSSIVVSHVVHGFRSNPFSMKAGNGAGDCHFNVACPEGAGKINAINSVALLIGGDGTTYCTGAMINNADLNGRQLMLTADHCIDLPFKSKNYMVGFNYQYKYCNSHFEFKPRIRTVHGARLLDRSEDTDYAILEVVENIPDDWNVYMAGWNAVASKNRTGSFFGVHHPSGDPKKVSLFDGLLESVILSDVNNHTEFWRVKSWDKGVTEHGSSGSPLFDSNGLIIGHLLGGDSSCKKRSSPDYYGALFEDWALPNSSIEKHINPKGNNGRILLGAPLQQLRLRSKPTEGNQITRPADSDAAKNTNTQREISIVVTKTVTIAKTTITKEVKKTVTIPVTVTTTFTRVPPPIREYVTVTVRK